MAYTRKQVADTIKSLRYAARTGACRTALFHMQTLASQPMRAGTFERLQSAVNRCYVNKPKRQRGYRDYR